MPANRSARTSFSDRFASLAAGEGEHEYLLRCARKHDDIVRVAQRAYLISRPEWINDIFMRTGKECQKFDNLIRNEANMQNQQAWMALRNSAAGGSGAVNVAPFIPRLVQLMNLRVDAWTSGSTFDAITEMRELTAQAIASYCFGDDVQGIPQACSALSRLFNSPGEANFVARWLAWPKYWQTVAAKARLTEEVEAAIERRQGAASDCERNDFLTVLLQPQHREPLPRSELARTLITMLLAAHQSPAATLAWIWFVLAVRPEVRSRLESEWSEVLTGRDVAADDLPKLIYTRAVINETLRVYPPAWLQSRRVVQPFQIEGVQFRRGDTLLLSPYVVGRDPRYFHEPDVFKPERWLDEAWTRSLPKGAFFPFGGGPRGCPGRHLGMTELLVTTATIGRRVRLEIDPGSRTTARPNRTLIPEGLRLVVHK